MNLPLISPWLLALSSSLLLIISPIQSFTPIPSSRNSPIRLPHITSTNNNPSSSSSSTSSLILSAGGFEWEDPTSEYADPGVSNPYLNPDLLADDESGTLKIDAARLLSPRLKGCNLYLVGMMGSGKSAVGEVLARRMNTYNFLDMDGIIERATGMSIPDIFESEGEDAFRDVEAQVEPEVIMKRIEGTDRPLLQTDDPLQTLREIMESRKAKYEQADVHVEIEEGLDVNEVADK
eukprot:scaffold392282_cov99-Cyclotella_meneghiniana.AAC.1